VASEPEALVRFLGQLGLVVTRIGLEAGPLSQWLHAGLTKAGLEVVLLETRQVKAALSAMVVQDRPQGRPRGIAQLLRMGSVWMVPAPQGCLTSVAWTSPAGVEGCLECPETRGADDGEAEALYSGVQGRSGGAAG
jgi:hypothetical protein